MTWKGGLSSISDFGGCGGCRSSRGWPCRLIYLRIKDSYELRERFACPANFLISSSAMNQPITEVGAAFRVPTMLSTSRSDIIVPKVVSPDVTLDYATKLTRGRAMNVPSILIQNQILKPLRICCRLDVAKSDASCNVGTGKETRRWIHSSVYIESIFHVGQEYY